MLKEFKSNHVNHVTAFREEVSISGNKMVKCKEMILGFILQFPASDLQAIVKVPSHMEATRKLISFLFSIFDSSLASSVIFPQTKV